MKLLCLAAAAITITLSVPPAAGAGTLERDFGYPAARFQITRNADGTSQVHMSGASRDFTPGHPDLPLVGERVELPAGMQVTGVQVVSMSTAPIASSARIPSAVVVEPGLGPVKRTAPDAALFGHVGFLPESPVQLGLQGDQRGANVAWLQVAPARWNPATGALERIDHVRVRLTLSPGGGSDLVRQRIVPEWEGGATATSSPPRTATGATLVSPDRTPGTFRPTQIPSLLGSPVQYVIVTGDDQASQFQRLADWKTQSGVSAVVRTMSFVRANYPFGADDAERVRLFIRDAYTRWGTQYVLLGGDTDVIPVRLASSTFYGGEMIASDLYYSCLDGNWNADGDSLYGEAFTSSSNPGDNCDLLPDVYVGRAPTSNAADAQRFVNKTLQYEKTPVGDYEKNLLFFAEVLFPQDWTPGTSTALDGAELVEEVLPMVQSDPSIHYGRLYENYTDPRWEPGALQEKRTVVIDSLNHGYNVAVHVGHGYRNVMSVGDDNLSTADASALTNGNRLTNLYAIDCTSNAIDFPCIGEAFLKAPNGGAVTNIGSTRFDFPTAGREYQKEYFTLLYQDSVNTIGQAQAMQKLPFVGFSTYDGVNRWTQMTLLLLGDPELHIWIGTPRTLAVTAPASVAATDSQFTVHVAIAGQPLLGARVTAYKTGDVFSSALTNGSGDAVMPFRPDSTGSLTLTVTGYDCRPYQSTIPVVSGSGDALGCGAVTIDDDGIGGTIGDANGLLDAGETVDLSVPVQNIGSTSTSSVSATLSTTDPMVTIVTPSASVGALSPGAKQSVVPAFRVSVPFSTPDQREIPFTVTMVDAGGHTFIQKFQLVAHAPEVRHNGHVINDVAGNNNGRVDAGETINEFVRLRNMGTGTGRSVTAVLRSLDGLATITDSTASFGTIPPGQEVQGDAFTFVAASASARFELRVSDQYGLLWTQAVDVVPPATPVDLLGLGAATTINLNWGHSAEADLLGYNVYRSSASGGPFTKLTLVPTDRVSYYLDGGLQGLTRYYYKVSAVDSSSNESALSSVQSASTNPPTHTIFPIPTGRNTPAPVAVDHLETGWPLDIAAGSEVLYLWHPDGSAPVDADGAGTTSGDFTQLGSYYAAGPSIGDLGDGGGKVVVGPSWETHQVFVFDSQGNVRPGWPRTTLDDLWSGVAIGDLDGDGVKELVTASRGYRFYAWHANGSEVLDGDANASTDGVFKVLGLNYNDGTPALAPLEGGNHLDIVFGGYDGYLYAWRADGTNVPGFPVNLGGGVAHISGSVAVGYLDGPGDPKLDIVVPCGDSLYVIQSDGSRHAGFPLFMRLTGTSKTPSPAIADMNGDGFNDIITATTNGFIYCWNHSGVLQFPWNVHYSTLTSGCSESSPVVADINGDGAPDVVMGDENGQLSAFSGVDGTLLPGFPIQLSAEVKGTPALCDCDGDGKTEIVVAGWDKNVYVWDYDFPFSPGKIPPWPQFHHDAQRTGYAGNLPWTAVDGAPAAPQRLELAAPAPNPARGGTRLRWGIPSTQEGATYALAIYDLSGRRVRTVATGTAHAGRFDAAWDLMGDDGTPAHAGVFFARLTVGAEMRSEKLVVMR